MQLILALKELLKTIISIWNYKAGRHPAFLLISWLFHSYQFKHWIYFRSSQGKTQGKIPRNSVQTLYSREVAVYIIVEARHGAGFKGLLERYFGK